MKSHSLVCLFSPQFGPAHSDESEGSASAYHSQSYQSLESWLPSPTLCSGGLTDAQETWLPSAMYSPADESCDMNIASYSVCSYIMRTEVATGKLVLLASYLRFKVVS